MIYLLNEIKHKKEEYLTKLLFDKTYSSNFQDKKWIGEGGEREA